MDKNRYFGFPSVSHSRPFRQCRDQLNQQLSENAATMVLTENESLLEPLLLHYPLVATKGNGSFNPLGHPTPKRKK